jgi:hypothetical protein
MSMARVLEFDIMIADAHYACIGAVGAHNAFDQRALAGAVFPDQGSEDAGAYFHGDVG